MKLNFRETVLNWMVEKRQTPNFLVLQEFIFLSILMFELGYL